MKVFLITVILVGLCLLGLCINIIFKKDGKFPDGEISHNKELKKRGIMCAQAEERILWSKKRAGTKRDRASCSTTEETDNPCSSCVSDCTGKS